MEANCSECLHLKFHRACSMASVHNGTGDGDPYSYWYCTKGHWDSWVEYTEDEWPGSCDCLDFAYKHKEDL